MAGDLLRRRYFLSFRPTGRLSISKFSVYFIEGCCRVHCGFLKLHFWIPQTNSGWDGGSAATTLRFSVEGPGGGPN
ncbi:predicted protein [Sclerotinia sclerotiorum 1980 UF-70]|uniref:Uncharacterized protein n=1 Tax=Sclerotinia sclerotiorum (strain ATCC 18683 / 1980 / Ss-1) TaxID=665079 RepID=A7F650_SCLS1|nr:predicted protein [Sclerotinia sclerotiorum 1980 UF-70]EDN98221.1 predicted protein [Sclerotinia sclerotiorum 1980 UF-70]